MIREYVVKVTDAFVSDAFQRFENEWAPEQELIRCKDCTYYDPEWVDEECRLLRDFTTQPDWFCADGKRKEE